MCQRLQKSVMYARSCEFTLFFVFRKKTWIKTVSLCQGVIVDRMLTLTLRKQFQFQMRKAKNVNLAEKRFVVPEDKRLPGA